MLLLSEAKRIYESSKWRLSLLIPLIISIKIWKKPIFLNDLDIDFKLKHDEYRLWRD